MNEFFLGVLLILVTFVFLTGISRSYVLSKKSVALIAKYEKDKKNPKLIQDIFAIISKDFYLGRILKKHNATEKDIAALHKKLMKWGDFRKYNRYIPITSFFNQTALKYLLEHKDDDAKSLTEKMMNHFHI